MVTHGPRILLAQLANNIWVPFGIFLVSVIWTVIRGAFTGREDWRNQVDEERDTFHDNFVKIDAAIPTLDLELKRPKRK